MGKEVVVIPLDEYRALCSMEGRVNALRDLVKRNRYISTEDALSMLGFEEEEHNAGEPNAD